MSDILNPPDNPESLDPPTSPRTAERGVELVGLVAIAAAEAETLLPPHVFEDPDFVKALATRDMGKIYKTALAELGLTHQELAEIVRLTQPHVSRAIRGMTVVTYRIMLDCAEGLRIPSEWMGLGYVAPGDDPRQQLEPGFAKDTLADAALCNPRFHEILRGHNITILCKILNEVYDIPQHLIGKLTHLTQLQVSRIIDGGVVSAYGPLLQICNGLGFPPEWMGLAYREPPDRLPTD